MRCCLAGFASLTLAVAASGCGSHDPGSGAAGSTASGGAGGGAAGGCQGAADCAAGNSCDPEARTCAKACDGNNEFSCGQGALCMSQDSTGRGACYKMCELFTNEGCAPDETCRHSNDLYSFGMCMKAGAAAIGAPCAGSAVSTGCVLGGLCVQMDQASAPVCTSMCDPWGPATCGAGKYCDPINLGLCMSSNNPYMQGAAIDAACDKNRDGYPCAAGKGICELVKSSGNVICHAACRTLRDDCPAGQTCHPWAASAPSSEADLPGSCY